MGVWTSEVEMKSFDARVRMVGQGGLPLGVEVDLTGERMMLIVEGNKLADWDLEEIRIMPTPNGFRIDAEGEAIILNVTDRARFERAIEPRLVYP